MSQQFQKGGLSSRDLFLMIVAFLQQDERQYQICNQHPDQVNLGELLLRFLKQFSSTDDIEMLKVYSRAPGQPPNAEPTIVREQITM